MENTNNTNPQVTGNGAGDPAATQPVNNQAANNPMTPEALAEAFAKALNTRTDRAERSVARSFAEQYGMTEAEVTALLEKAKADKANAIPPDVQKQIDAANKRADDILIVAETKNISAELGFIDADVAFQLMDKTNVKVEAGKATGIREALEALKEAKPFLTGKQGGAWGQKQGGAPVAKTAAEIAKITDRDERRKAIADNMKLFKKE
jgi:hypothetical protein